MIHITGLYEEILENLINAVIDYYRVRRDGEPVTFRRFMQAVAGQGRIRPLPDSVIDERITKLDDVQSYLNDAIDAIDDLKVQADENRSIQKQLIAEVDALRESQRRAECEAREIEEATQININGFRKLAGIPTEDEVWRGKIFGFVSGILASLVAALIWWGATKMFS